MSAIGNNGPLIGQIADIIKRLWATLAPWFPDLSTAPVLNSILTAIADSFAFCYQYLQFAAAQTRIATATGGWLDLIAWDFFGGRFTRRMQTVQAQRTNVALESNSFSTAPWVSTNSKATGAAAVSPDGTVDAWQWQRLSTATAFFKQGPIARPATAIPWTFSIYAEAGNGVFLAMYLSDTIGDPNAIRATFNLSTGTVAQGPTVGAGGVTSVTATITPATNGFYRCSISGVMDADPGLVIGFSGLSTNLPLEGIDPASNTSIYVYGAQLEQAGAPTGYIPTTVTAVTQTTQSLSNVESDASWANRIVQEILRPRQTREAIRRVVNDLTGANPQIQEAWNPYDWGCYGNPAGGCGYGIARGYGSLQYPNQVFITVLEPAGAGIPLFAGYGNNNFGAYGAVGAYSQYCDMSQVTGGVTPAEIYARIAQTIAAGITAWVSFISAFKTAPPPALPSSATGAGTQALPSRGPSIGQPFGLQAISLPEPGAPASIVTGTPPATRALSGSTRIALRAAAAITSTVNQVIGAARTRMTVRTTAAILTTGAPAGPPIVTPKVSGSWTPPSGTTISFSANAGDVIVVDQTTSSNAPAPTINAPTATGLTFQHRGSSLMQLTADIPVNFDRFYAVCASSFSGTISLSTTGGPVGTPSLVQKRTAPDPGGNTSPASFAFAAAVSSGSVVIGSCTSRISAIATPPTVTDDKGNAYTVVAPVYDSADQQGVFLFLSNGPITNAPTTITVTQASGTFMRISLQEWAGVQAATDGSASQYQANIATGTDAVSSGSFTTTVAGDLIYAATCDPQAAQAVTMAAGTGFTLGGTGASLDSINIADEYRIQTAAGSVAGTFTVTLGPLSWCTAAMALKASTAGTGAAATYSIYTVTGANTSAPFDPNAVLPAQYKNDANTTAVPTKAFSTTNPNTAVVTAIGSARTAGDPGPPSGFAEIHHVTGTGGPATDEFENSYQRYTSAQTGTTVSGPAAIATSFMIIDAFQAAGGGGTTGPTMSPQSFSAATPLVLGQHMGTMVVTNGSATQQFLDDFTAPLNMMTSATDTGKTWRPNNPWQDVTLGYVDFAGTNWNINPNTNSTTGSVFAPYNPFTVANSILKISSILTPSSLSTAIQQQMSLQGVSGSTPAWSGGILVNNPLVQKFKYGYFEIRARYPIYGKGMFPALWFYASDGSSDPLGKGTAEIDMLEMYGAHDLVYTTLVNPTSLQTSTSEDTDSFHIYAMDWQPTYINFYYDGNLIWSNTGSQAAWYNTTMTIMLNYAMNAPWFGTALQSDGTTPSPLTAEIDYVRVSNVRDPYTWAITAGNSAGYFAITTSGDIVTTTASVPTGTYTLTISATNSTGTGTATATVTITGGLADGLANASGGPAQLPNILNIYNATGTGTSRSKAPIGGRQYQPPWNVAGVDYAVGPQSGTTFLDGSIQSNLNTIAAGSGSVTVSSGQVTVNTGSAGNNITINGFDFTTLAPLASGSSGNMFTISGSGNVTIQNCKFKNSPNATGGSWFFLRISGAANVTFQYCDIDGNGYAIGANSNNLNGGGPAVWNNFEIVGAPSAALNFFYNYFHNGVFGGVAPSSSTTGVQTFVVTIKYNLWAYNNYLWVSNVSHFDPIIVYGGTNIAGGGNALIIQFNTFYQPSVDQNGHSIGYINGFFRVGDQDGSSAYSGIDIGWNTVVAPGGGYGTIGTNGGGVGACLSILQVTNSGSTSGISNCTAHDNFFDFSYIQNFWCYNITASPPMNNFTYINNILLNTGGQAPTFSGNGGSASFNPTSSAGNVWNGQGNGGKSQTGADSYGFPPYVAPTSAFPNS